jgi:uncharacterized membrane protein YfcA
MVHGLNRTVDWRVVGRLCVGSIPVSLVTLALLSVLSIKGLAANSLFGISLGVALLLTSLTLVFRRQFVARYGARVAALPEPRLCQLTVLTGAVLGALVTLSSVGAGALGATALVLLYPSLPASRIAGSDIAHAVPLTLVAGLGHLLLGTVDLSLLLSLLVGSLPGIFIGSVLVVRIPEPVLRIMLATVLALVAIKLFWSSIH